MGILGAVAAGLLTGVLSGFGIGGGSLLLLYLTLFAGFGQYAAGGSTCCTSLRARPRRSSRISETGWWTAKRSAGARRRAC